MLIRHGPMYYQGAPAGYVPAPCHQWLVDNCAEVIAPDPGYFTAIKTLKPTFPCFSYTSAMDDYTKKADGTDHPDYLRVKAHADALGVPIETMYLHWAEDTTVTVWVEALGGPGPKFYPAGSRIEMDYQAHQSGYQLRELCSFLPAARPVQTAVHLEIAQQVSNGRQWGGLMLDNCACQLFGWGDPLRSGGTVLEAGMKINAPGFNGWWWQNLRDWLSGFRPQMAGIGKLLAMNMSSTWTDEYLTHETADRLCSEFVGNPIRDSWPPILEAARRNQLADEHGIGIWYSCNPALGSPAESWAEMQYASLCFYLAVSTPRTLLHIQDWTGPYGMKPGGPSLSPPTWPQRVVSPVESHPQFRLLGNPTGPVELVGTRGPSTRLQRLYMRPFDRGGVWVRQMEPYNGLTTETWDVSVGPQMIYLPPDGSTPNPRPTTVQIKNGGGAIMIRA